MMNRLELFSKTTHHKAVTACCALVFLSACATGKDIRSTDDIVDDGERNTMLVSYDFSINVTDKHPKVGRTDLIVNCGEANRLGSVPECFRVGVPFRGRKSLNGYEYYSFGETGAKLVQMPYGAYELQSVRHNVVVDVVSHSRCSRSRNRYHRAVRHSTEHRSRLLRRLDCVPFLIDVNARFSSKTPDNPVIEIGSGSACYAGHLKLEMIDGKITQYAFDQNAQRPSADVLAQLSRDFQQTLEQRGLEACAASAFAGS